jgi:D-alanyl-D-alanine carboxypeptidase
MWQQLGTLITEDAPVAAPQIVNSEGIEKAAAMELDGPPFVTCQAWGETGKLLWSQDSDQPLHPASTTKIMTGYLVVLLAQDDPTVWDELVTFPSTADATSG